MDDMEQKLNAILGNPQMMSQLMSMAQSLGNSQEENSAPPPPTMPSQLSGVDFKTLQKVAGFAQQSGIDTNQQALLRALRPYLSPERISKLEKAMRAAKIAGFATTAIGSGALFQLGR